MGDKILIIQHAKPTKNLYDVNRRAIRADFIYSIRWRVRQEDYDEENVSRLALSYSIDSDVYSTKKPKRIRSCSKNDKMPKTQTGKTGARTSSYKPGQRRVNNSCCCKWVQGEASGEVSSTNITSYGSRRGKYQKCGSFETRRKTAKKHYTNESQPDVLSKGHLVQAATNWKKPF